MKESTLSRRRFLTYAGLASSAALAVACGGSPAPTTAPPEATVAPATAAPATAAPTTAAATMAPEATKPAETAVAASKYGEAPMLADMVTAGSLPPVEERLPKEPMVIPVTEEIGEYGGTWHRVAVGPGDAGLINSRLSAEFLLRMEADGKTLYPNVLKDFETNADATEFTMYLREGMKWSDGSPITADDYIFRFDDIYGNADLSPSFPKWLRDPGTDQPGTLEKVDDYTLKISFASPYGLFPQILGGPTGQGLQPKPKQYLQQFHVAYADADELAAAVKEASFENWYQLYGNKDNWQNPECPVLWPWIYTRVPPDVPVVADRNPYYWKVDPEGNQLPYIDHVNFDVVENADLLNLKAVAGEIDMQFRHILWTNFPLFVENAEQGDYRVMKWTLAEGSNFGLYLNLNHLNPEMRSLIENRDFRIALSLGINRSDMNELAYQGFGVPRQASLVPQCPYFKEEHATLYADLDPEQANQLLDDIGITERDSEGFRLLPGGQPLTITIEYAPVFGPWKDVAQIMSDQWQAIGIRGIPKEEDRTLLTQRGQANERDAGVWQCDRCFTPLIEPYWFMPTGGGYSGWENYALWYTSGGEQGEEPPAEIKLQCDLYDQIKAATADKVPALAEQFFDNFSQNVWVIGTVGVLPHVGVVKNNFRNVPEEAISDWLQLTPGNTNVEQYFIRQS